jgi:hypothetical protein
VRQLTRPARDYGAGPLKLRYGILEIALSAVQLIEYVGALVAPPARSDASFIGPQRPRNAVERSRIFPGRAHAIGWRIRQQGKRHGTTTFPSAFAWSGGSASMPRFLDEKR